MSTSPIRALPSTRSTETTNRASQAQGDGDSGALLAGEQARAERLARAVRSESRKRADVQSKNRRLHAEVVRLEQEAFALRLKRHRTAATLLAVRRTLREERDAASHHFKVRQALEKVHGTLLTNAEWLQTQAASTALQLARFVGRTNTLTLQLSTLQKEHGELRTVAGQFQYAEEKARQELEAARMEAQTTTEAYHARLKDIEHLEEERTRLATELEQSGEALERALLRAEEAEGKLAALSGGGGA